MYTVEFYGKADGNEVIRGFLYAKMPFVYVLDNAVVCKVKCVGSEKLADCTPPVCQETEDAE